MEDPRFDRALAAIDAANADDPTTVAIDGVERPKELVHAELMTRWVLELDPGADAAQLLAARAHHIRRWEIPRSEYPDGRAGYLRWRAALKRRHAEEVGSILADVNYDQALIGRVQRLIRKDGLGTEAATQTHEDALCLVFMTMQFDDLITRLGPDHTVGVVAKTLAKMSDRGRELALALPLSELGMSVVTRALAEG